MSDIQTYYADYFKKYGDAGYTGEKHRGTSRFLWFKRELDRLSKLGAKALDLGCGDATFSVQNPSFEWYGMDFNIEKTVGRPVTATAHDLEVTPYPYSTASMDVVTCSEVVEHLFSPEKVFSEAKRILKRDGTFLLSCPQHTWIENTLTGFRNLIYDNRKSHTVEHIRTYDLPSLTKLANEVGFEVISNGGTCGHFCNIVNPMAVCTAEMLRSKYGVTVPVSELHLAMGDGLPTLQHTITLVMRKV